MLYNMKKLSFRKSFLRIMLFIAAGLMGIILLSGKVQDYITGPQDLTSGSFVYENDKYVEYDLDDVMVMDCFLERKDVDAKRNTTDYYYYILGVADKKDKIVKCMVLMTDSEKNDIYYKYNKYFKDKLNGKSGKSPENFVDKGKLVPVTSVMQQKMMEYVRRYKSINYSAEVYCEPYCIIPYEPGNADVIVFGFSCFLVFCAFAEIILIQTGFKQRKIRKYLIRNCAGGIKAAEDDYQYSRFFNKSVRIGDIYTYILQREGISLIDNKKILWVYECVATGRNNKGSKPDAGYSGIEIWDNEFNCYEIFINNRNTIDSILDYITLNFPYIIVGYNNNLSNMFFNNNMEFKNLVYNKYSVQNQQDGGNI